MLSTSNRNWRWRSRNRIHTHHPQSLLPKLSTQFFVLSTIIINHLELTSFITSQISPFSCPLPHMFSKFPFSLMLSDQKIISHREVIGFLQLFLQFALSYVGIFRSLLEVGLFLLWQGAPLPMTSTLHTQDCAKSLE